MLSFLSSNFLIFYVMEGLCFSSYIFFIYQFLISVTVFRYIIFLFFSSRLIFLPSVFLLDRECVFISVLVNCLFIRLSYLVAVFLDIILLCPSSRRSLSPPALVVSLLLYLMVNVLFFFFCKLFFYQAFIPNGCFPLCYSSLSVSSPSPPT